MKRSLMRRAVQTLVAASATMIAARDAYAQNLGPFRQFLAVEPYYAYTQIDVGGTTDKVDLSGFGARLWLNTAPFGVTDKLGVGLFVTRYPQQNHRGVAVTHYGGQLELFPVHRPIGGWFDPFITAGAGAYRSSVNRGVVASIPAGGSNTKLALTRGVGVRIPIPNRFQLRFDARDAIVQRGSLFGPGGSGRMNNLELLAALGLTF